MSVRCCLDVVAVSLIDVVQQWRLPVYRVKAIVPGSDVEASVVYFGELPQHRVWTHTLWGRDIEPEFVGEANFLQVFFGSAKLPAADMMVFPLNKVTASLFSMKGWHLVPRFLNYRVDLGASISDIFSSRDAKNERRATAKKNYTFKTLNADEYFDEFYHEMLLPTIALRHGKRALIAPFESLRETMRCGFLLGVFAEDEWLGACMLVRESSTVLRAANIAYRGGDPDLLKQRVLSALEIEKVMFARERGFRWLDNGACNPFPTDGALHYKMKWGGGYSAPAIEYDGQSLSGVRNLFALKVNLEGPGSRNLLQRTPIFELAGGTLRVMGWNSVVPSVFRKELKAGLEWLNLDPNRAGDENLAAHEKPLS